MIDKNDVFKMGELIRDVEKSLDKLHRFAHRMSVKHAGDLGLKKASGDFATLSGGVPKDPPPE